MAAEELLLRTIAESARPLSGAAADLDGILELTRQARCVLLGEATHGTHEFYRRRAELTQRLVLEQGFAAVAVEADWPDAYRVNRYVRGLGHDEHAEQALRDFRRFPVWMWRNADVLEFVEWLRAHNESQSDSHEVGFYGLDLYSLHASMGAVLAYLERTDRAAAERARARYACFDDFGDDPERYAHFTALGLSADCEQEAVAQLVELQRRQASLGRGEGLIAEDEHFHAERNAAVVRDAEKYYRSMLGGRAESWNLRDTHMADTLTALLRHLGTRREQPKVVVWAHNSHVGDARATQFVQRGELNLGQLMREREAEQAVLIGFSTSGGTVTAASDWERPAEHRPLNPPLPNSWEDLLHRVGYAEFLLRMRDLPASAEVDAAFATPRLQRAVGVVYKSKTERFSHYFTTQLHEQFDALVHIDHTRALQPLESLGPPSTREEPDTFPTGL
jgi:erythromycin esterase-like protein